MESIAKELEKLSEEELNELMARFQPAALRAAYQYEKEENWRKYSNKPK